METKVKWNKFPETYPTESGKYIVIYYGEIDSANWNAEYNFWNTKWVEDEDGEMIDIVYGGNVTYWAMLQCKPKK